VIAREIACDIFSSLSFRILLKGKFDVAIVKDRIIKRFLPITEGLVAHVFFRVIFFLVKMDC